MFTALLCACLPFSGLSYLRPTRISEVRNLAADNHLRIISEDGSCAILNDGNGFLIGNLKDGSELSDEWIVSTTQRPPGIYTDSQVAHVPGYRSKPPAWSTFRMQPRALYGPNLWVAAALGEKWLTLGVIDTLKRGSSPNDLGHALHGISGRFGPSGQVGVTKLLAEVHGVRIFVPERRGSRVVVHEFLKQAGSKLVTKLMPWTVQVKANEWVMDIDAKRRRVLVALNGEAFSIVSAKGRQELKGARSALLFRDCALMLKDRNLWLTTGGAWRGLGPYHLQAKNTTETIAYFRNTQTGKLYRLEF